MESFRLVRLRLLGAMLGRRTTMLATAAALAGCGVVAWLVLRRDPGPAAVAIVNGAEISPRAIQALAADHESFAGFRPQLVERAIADQLIRQDAARRGISLSEREERELEDRLPPGEVLRAQARDLGLTEAELTRYRRDLVRTQALLRKLVEADFPGALDPSDAELRDDFERAPLAFADPPSVTVRAFLIALPDHPDIAAIDEAAARAARLVAAAKQLSSAEAFSRLAAAEAVVPDGLPDGKIGTLHLADPFAPPPAVPALFGPALSGEVMVALFPAPASNVDNPARVVGPFRGPRGMFGLWVEERSGPGRTPTFDEVRDRVRVRWLGRAQIALVSRVMERLRASATIQLVTAGTAT